MISAEAIANKEFSYDLHRLISKLSFINGTLICSRNEDVIKAINSEKYYMEGLAHIIDETVEDLKTLSDVLYPEKNEG
ncbi:MAG: hypothetical protein HQK78_14490 [Desulfobacterales bacterium]|nr:hypothetical protein [Desulfobacterales bacterium]